jgi:hypothetical protein
MDILNAFRQQSLGSTRQKNQKRRVLNDAKCKLKATAVRKRKWRRKWASTIPYVHGPWSSIDRNVKERKERTKSKEEHFERR